MRWLASELESYGNRMPNPWSLVKDPEEFWGDWSTHGRRLLCNLLEGTMEIWRDEYVQAAPHRGGTTCLPQRLLPAEALAHFSRQRKGTRGRCFYQTGSV
jgi:hypothetical protein